MIWHLLKKDFLRLRKHPAGFLFLIAIPIVLASLMSFIFGNDNGNGQMPRVKLVIEDHEDNFVSGLIRGAFNQGQMAEMFEVQEVEKGAGAELIEEDKAAALLIIPKGFSDSLLAQHPTALVLLKNPSQAFGPKIAEETVTILAQVGDRFLRLGAPTINTMHDELQTSGRMSDQSTATLAVSINRMMTQIAPVIFDPPITLAQTSIAEAEKPVNDMKMLFAVLLSGLATLCLFFILNGLAADYFREREQVTLYRILVTPAGMAAFAIAKQLYLFCAGLLSLVAVWILAFTLWGIPVAPAQLAPFFVILILTTAAAVGIVSLLYSFMRTRNQAAAIVPAVVIFLSLFGGGMVPIQALPRFFQRLAVASPVYWGIDGMQKILVDNRSLVSVATHLAVLAAVAMVTVTFAILLQKRRRLA